MLRIILLNTLFMFIAGISQAIIAEEFTFKGVYQGKNIYVQNPLSDDRKNFCTKAVYVNDLLVVNNPKTSAYEVDLSYLSINEPLLIKIIHSGGCVPKVINPQVIRAKNKFQFLSVYVDSSVIRWITKSEVENGKYFLEQYISDKWVIIDMQEAIHDNNTNQYQTIPKHERGLNRYRIKYVTEEDVFYSQVQQFYAKNSPVTVMPDTAQEKIVLSRETDYEILDAEGNQVAQGKAKEIDLVHLSAGLYYLNIENRTEKIIKK